MGQSHRRTFIIGNSSGLQRVLSVAEQAAQSDAPILILGETGTGKELLARHIHEVSSRHEHPFVPIDCAGLPTGLQEAELFGHKRGAFTGAVENRQGLIRFAGSGTVFLDEIGDLPLHAQPGLLRFLQEGEVRPIGEDRALSTGCRVIAATNRNLRDSIQDKSFRSDLYFRLAVVVITVPPLRDRPDDLVPLAEHFLQKHCGERRLRFAEDIPSLLLSYSWPGNVRELENVIRRAICLGKAETISASALFLESTMSSRAPDTTSLKSAERELIVNALLETNHVLHAANKLGIPRTTLYAKIKKMKLPLPSRAKAS